MSGYIKDENSLANGIPNRTIGPETGSFGNATKTNHGDTSEGVNQARPAPAAGLEGDRLETDNLGEDRSFGASRDRSTTYVPEDRDLESPAQQIADGDDHFKHGKRFSDDDHDHIDSPRKGGREGLSDDSLDRPFSDDRLGR